MTDDLRARLIECFAAVFPELSEPEIPRASPESVAEWDSLRAVRLLATIEETFDCVVAPTELDEMVSFERILRYLEGKRRSS
ncbi:MAG TPA: acyl carrier protein [Planctomycetota bacterium]|nr:acyl carrier protein [Planctomycetota bacterium]HRR78856.1 acyl carrier protein [Planctomycetota bacterium]HRT92838.1 acyl carrier protein [Planctomycetota bacterium]